ncbi:MAG: nucleotide exchange factor GrpE [Pseudomonadota bacterium]|mgnify:CR=1 FL=1
MTNEEQLETKEVEEVAPPSLEEKIAALEDRNLRLMAEMENMRQRFEKERADALKFGAQRFAGDILSAADTLDMALQTIHQNVAPKTIVVGIEMVQKEIQSAFERNHIQKFASIGEVFDPQKHDAMLEVQEGDAPANTIVKEIKSGYTMHGKLLRPAMVGVKKG